MQGYYENQQREVLRYLQEVHTPTIVQAHIARMNDAMSFFQPFVQEPILDIGCRDGLLLTCLRKQGFMHMFGLELVQEAVAAARAKKLDVLQADAHELAFEAGSFGTVLMSHVLEHCHTPSRAALECMRVLRHQGTLFLEVPVAHQDNPGEWGHYYNFVDARQLTLFFPRFHVCARQEARKFCRLVLQKGA